MKRPVTLSTLVFAAVWLAVLGSPVQAAWSGKNGRIAFCDFSAGDCVITTMNADGSGRQALHSGIAPNWAPDGSKMVFVDGAHRSGQLFTMNADGSGVQQVTHLDGDNVDPSWSPDGNLLVFVHYPVGHCCPNIFTIRPNGSGVRQVTSFGTDIGAQEPEFSPDGKSIAFWQASVGGGDLAAIFIMRADGSGVRQVTQLELDADHPEWSPDGSRLVFNNDAHQGVGDIFTIRPDGSGLKRLTNVIPLGLADFRPAYSPDGSAIVFNQGTGTTTLVMTMKANGGNPIVISSDGFGPDWGVLAR